jgi:hypothetical protein
VGGETAWVFGYGIYDELSVHMQKLLEGLHATYTSSLQYDTTTVRIYFNYGHLKGELIHLPRIITTHLTVPNRYSDYLLHYQYLGEVFIFAYLQSKVLFD